MDIAIKSNVTIPDHLLDGIAADLITTACEGGINQWASCEDYQWGCKTLGHSRKSRGPWLDTDTPYASVIIHDDEDEDFEPKLITIVEMKAAIAKLMAGEIKTFYGGYDKTYRDRLADLFAQITRHPDRDLLDYDYDFDADDADCMMQIAVFGEVIYG